MASWPWERARKPWCQGSIFKHLSRVLEEWGVTRAEASSVIVSQIADSYWVRQEAIAAIRAGEERIRGVNALTLLSKCNAQIASGFRQLGLLPLKKQQVEAPAELDFS